MGTHVPNTSEVQTLGNSGMGFRTVKRLENL
ncbi:hypothetical protein [Pseudomonas fluorescens]